MGNRNRLRASIDKAVQKFLRCGEIMFGSPRSLRYRYRGTSSPRCLRRRPKEDQAGTVTETRKRELAVRVETEQAPASVAQDALVGERPNRPDPPNRFPPT